MKVKDLLSLPVRRKFDCLFADLEQITNKRTIVENIVFKCIKDVH